MSLRPVARYITLLIVLASPPGAALAAEALSNAAMGDSYVADTTAPRCKPLTAAQANITKTPCPTLNSSTSATNADQDALARHAFAGNAPHTVSVDTVIPDARQVLQNREDVVTYTSYGGGPPGGPMSDRH
jgi:hypothetical protein